MPGIGFHPGCRKDHESREDSAGRSGETDSSLRNAVVGHVTSSVAWTFVLNHAAKKHTAGHLRRLEMPRMSRRIDGDLDGAGQSVAVLTAGCHS
jgi:hypothetical protein